MGWGHFSTVWLAFNFKDKRLYALKIMRSQLRYQEHGLEEETLNRVIADNHDNPLWVMSLKEQAKHRATRAEVARCLGIRRR